MAVRSPAYKIILLLLLVLPLTSHSQTFRFSQYTTHNGLPIDNVYAAAQDSDGFMWFGTDFGIARFDGVKFTVYDKKNGMANKAVTDIVYAGGDSLVFISYPFTIQAIHTNGRINTLATTAMSLQEITKHNQQYYFYQRRLTLFALLENGRSRLLKADSVLGVPETLINAIVDLEEKGVAFCTTTGLYVQTGSGISRFMPNRNVQSLIYSKQKGMISVVEGQLMESGAGFDFRELPFAFPKGFAVYHAARDADGAVWFRGLDKGVYRLLNNQMLEMSARLSLENRGINEFFQDGDGNFWICTDGSGLLLKKSSAFIQYETSDGLINNKILKLLKQNNVLFIGTSNGISVLENDRISSLQLPSNGQGLKYVFQLFAVNKNVVGVSVEKAFFTEKPGVPENPVKDLQISGHALRAFKSSFAWQESEDKLWMYQSPSLILLQKGRQDTTYFDVSKFGVRKIYSAMAFPNKNWFGTDAGIISFENNKINCIDSVGQERLGQVFDFVDDGKGRIWFATEIGLFVNEGGRLSAFSKGPTTGSNYCRDITVDDEGKIWAATWDGVFYTDGKTTKYLNTNNGLPSKTANCIEFDSARRELYVGTDNGLAILKHGSLIDTGGHRNIFIKCTIAGNDSAVLNNNSSLSSSKNSLGFYLSFPWYQGIGNISYDYKMDNGNWVNTESPSIAISKIASGAHEFHARAKLNGQPVNGATAYFSFTIEKPYYETWWFLLLFVLVFQLLIFLIINYFNKKAKARKLAVQSQQAEYASLKQQAFTLLMNPHFIFNALNSVQHYVNRQDRQSANKYLSNFATLIRRSFDASQRSFVSLDEELETIRLYLELEKMRFTDKFDYIINVSPKVADEDWMLPSMMLQPFLENAVLHGLMPLNEKGLINIEAAAVDNSLHVTLTDNGIGIEKSKAFRSDGNHKSKGMQLIKERLELLSKLSKEPLQLIISEANPGAPNPGTKIILVIPQEAYSVFQQQRKQ